MDSSFNQRFENTGTDVNFARLINRILGEWKVISLCAMIGLGIAFLINRYATNIYELKTTIYLEVEENPFLSSNVSLIFNWGSDDDLLALQKTVLKSRSHNKKVIANLPFEVSYKSEGRIKEQNMFGTAPVEVVYDDQHEQALGLPFYYSLGEGGLKVSVEPILENQVVRIYNYATGEIRSVKTADFPISVFEIKFDEWVESEYFKFKLIPVQTKFDDNEKRMFFTFRNPENIWESYSEKLKIEQIESAGTILELSCKGPNKKMLELYLNETVSELIQFELAQKNRVADNTLEFIEEQLRLVEDTLHFAEQELQNFRKSNQLLDLGEESRLLMDRYLNIQSASNQIRLTEEYFDYLEGYLSSNMDYSDLIAPALINDGNQLVSDLVSRLVQLNFEFDKYRYTIEDSNPLKQRLISEMKQTKASLTEALSSAKEALKIEKRDVASKMTAIELEIGRLPEIEQTYLNINRRYQLSDQQYTYLLEKQSEVGIVKASNTPNTKVIDSAEDFGQEPIGPNKTRNYAVALALGLFLPTGFLVFKTLMNSKVQEKKEVEEALGIPVVGSIGHSYHQTNLVVQKSPKSAIAEGFRSVRMNLPYLSELSKSSVNGTCVLVTSSVGGEGKTFSSINLALVLAGTEERVVLLGMDLRKPKIFNDFNLTNEVGLTNYLVGNMNQAEIIQKTENPNLDIVAAGPIPPNPSELLVKKELDDLIASLKKSYDWILMDTPPVALVADGIHLAKYADVNLFVVRHNYTDKGLLEFSKEQFVSKNSKNTGVIYNDIKHEGKYGYNYGYSYGYNYGYGYGYGYGYFEEEEARRGLLSRLLKRRK